MSTQPTLAEIAAVIGVSVMTVSKVLRGEGRISKTMRERVKAEAARRGYQPNPHGVGLVRARKGQGWRGTLALLVGHKEANPRTANPPHPLHYHYPRMVAGVRTRAAELGYGLDVFWVYEPGLSAERLEMILWTRGIEGLVLLSVQPGEISINWTRYACAYLGRPENADGVAFAWADFYSATRLAYLKTREAGYRRIGLVIDTVHDRLTEGRCTGACVATQLSCKDPRVNPLICPVDALNRSVFSDWMEREGVDAVLSLRNRTQEWLTVATRTNSPGVGRADLDLRTCDGRIAGIWMPYERIGMAGVDLVNGQLQRNERGLLATTAEIGLLAEWKPGASMPQVADEGN
ncbi:MAG: LacI family DNA-binding transcriptional regulator [Opitutaceae bacterium]|jgi:DNA-binding LacI/PurR family transcriptional regulator